MPAVSDRAVREMQWALGLAKKHTNTRITRCTCGFKVLIMGWRGIVREWFELVVHGISKVCAEIEAMRQAKAAGLQQCEIRACTQFSN